MSSTSIEMVDPIFAAWKEIQTLRRAGGENTFPDKEVDDDRPARFMLLAEREAFLERVVLETEAHSPAGLLAQAMMLEEVNADIQSDKGWSDPHHVEKLIRRQRFAIFSLINGLSEIASIDPQSLRYYADGKDPLDNPHALCRLVANGSASQEADQQAA